MLEPTSLAAAAPTRPIRLRTATMPAALGIGTMQPGGGCTVATECQSLNCTNGACGSTCISDGQACTTDGSCCGGKCANGMCSPLNTTCKTGGNTCAGNNDCCSHLCQGGTCVLGSSFCIQTGDTCVHPSDCCGGTCNIATGATLGTCGAPPSGPSFCNGGVDGTVCGGCNDCCSRLCAPYGPSGVKVCQRANGCHIDGDLCREDGDCCGAKGSMAPGDGNVVCDIPAGFGRWNLSKPDRLQPRRQRLSLQRLRLLDLERAQRLLRCSGQLRRLSARRLGCPALPRHRQVRRSWSRLRFHRRLLQRIARASPTRPVLCDVSWRHPTAVALA